MVTQREYASTVTIQVARDTPKILNIEGVGGGVDPSSFEFYQTQYELLKSRSLAEGVVRKLQLADNYLFLANFDRPELDEYRSMPRSRRLRHAVAIVQADTEIEPVLNSSIINIHYASPEPAMAAAIANATAAQFIEMNLSRRFESAAYARQFLQSRLNQVRTRLEASERRAVQYAAQQGLFKVQSNDGEQATEQSLVGRDLLSSSDKLARARAGRAQAEAENEAGSRGAIAASSLSNLTVNALRQQRANLQGEMSKLSASFGPEYPAVVALRAQIAELDQQLGREQARVRSGVSSELAGRYRQALATEAALQARVDSLKSQLLGEQRRSIQYTIIQRDVDSNRALYDSLLQRYKEVGVAGGIGANNISVIDSALPSKTPFKPKLVLNILVALLVGILLSAGAALILEHLDEATIQPSDLQGKLGIPLLGSTPKVDSDRNIQQELEEPKSELSESYFSVLTALQFSTAHGTPRSLMFTSSQAGEGKSTSCFSLARALASIGSNVLLIDADMRNPSIHRMLELSLRTGLSNVLTGSQDLWAHIQTEVSPNLAVLLAGPIPPNPAELLAADSLRALINEAAQHFDHVLVDGPPVLGLADAPLIARAVEATVLVLETSRTRAIGARHSISRLGAVRANLIGAIITKLDIGQSAYGYGYEYSYRYGPA